MRLGILIPHRAVVLQSVRRPPVETCWTIARLCDASGLDLWVGDSVVAKPRLDADAERTQTLTRSFLQHYYGGGVHYHGLMGLGPASTVIDMIKRYEAAGVTNLCIRLVGDDQVAQLEQFIHEVVPACMI